MWNYHPKAHQRVEHNLTCTLWFLARRRTRRGEILFVDGRKLGRMVDRNMNKQIAPTEDIVEQFGIYVSHIFARRHCVNTESMVLVSLRDICYQS